MWEGNAARVTFREVRGRWRAVRLESLPTLVTPYGVRDSLRYLDVNRALTQPHWRYLRSRLLAARHDVLSVVGSLGVRPGATFLPAASGSPPH
jgi:hypothetical protein